MKAKKILLFGVMFCLSLLSSSLLHSADVSDFYFPNPEGKGELFSGGVYIYRNSCDKIELDSHLRTLSQLGFNGLHINKTASPTETPTDTEIVDICDKYGFKITFQLDLAYLNGGESETLLAILTDRAVQFIDDFYQEDSVVDFSVREEPTLALMPELLDYYATIIAAVEASSVPFWLLHCYDDAAEEAYNATYHAVSTGLDYYPLKWSYANDIGYISTPKKADELFYNRFKMFRAYMDNTDQYPRAVITANTNRQTHTKAYLQSTYPSKYARFLTLAQYNSGEGNQGLKEDGDNIKSWQRYRPPVNYTKAQVWLSVATGYKSVFVWHCNPTGGTDINSGMMGSDDKGDDTLYEYGEAIRSLQKFGWIINRMNHEAVGQYVSYTDSPLKTIYSGSFSVPNYTGKVALVVNADLGVWAGSSTNWLQTTDVYRITEAGEVHSSDYTANTSLRTIAITKDSTLSGTMYDLETGDLIGDSGNISVLPGEGKFVFIGDQTELEDIRAKCGISSLIQLVGKMNGDRVLENHIRWVYPVEPIVNNSSYSLGTQSVLHDNMYRLHVTASSTDGAQLGALGYGFDQSWNILQTVYTSLWNTGLSSTPTTLTSRDFKIDESQATRQYVYLYRSNQQGTITIDDVWLEDTQDHERVTGYYYSNTSKKFWPGETYKVHVKARNISTDPAPATIGVKLNEYNAANKMIKESHIIPWNSSLSENATEYSGTFQSTLPQTSYMLVIFYRANMTSGDGTLILEKAWVEVE